ncbi:MAG: glycosyltransferase family 2 protein, partial [Candidatus Heimdallarchaeota archaeon]|nr:glycosyltransferase family 2 protein [Candidatus Heimdallarchaeota archaeon]
MVDGQIDISIVIPAFNESKRLPQFLPRVIAYCQETEKICEIIVVDDGSSDATFDIASSFKAKFNNLSVLRNERNSGKGHATKKGLFTSRGNIRVFLDADGSVDPQEISENLHYIEEGHDIFVGSRILTAQTQILKVKWYRKFIGQTFNFFVRKFLFAGIKDTQCGFKMFKGGIVEPLFSRIYLRGFGFDIEFLYLAHKLGYKVKEGAVSWHHVSGSKINIVMDSIRMFFNILQVRNWHCTPINHFSKHMGPDEYWYMYEMEEYHWWFVSRRNFILNLI